MVNYESFVQKFKAIGRDAIEARTEDSKVVEPKEDTQWTPAFEVGESMPKNVQNVDIMFEINRYFDTVSDEDFLKHLKEAGFKVILRKGKRVE